jgi:hypothetical protein
LGVNNCLILFALAAIVGAFKQGASMNFILYGTEFCQLCDEALVLVEQALECSDYQLDIVDISSSDELIEKYAYRIPVLARISDEIAVLDWPFAERDVQILAK